MAFANLPVAVNVLFVLFAFLVEAAALYYLLVVILQLRNHLPTAIKNTNNWLIFFAALIWLFISGSVRFAAEGAVYLNWYGPCPSLRFSVSHTPVILTGLNFELR